GSNAARLPRPAALSYTAAKTALATYSKGLAGQVGPHNVPVNLVSPAVIETSAFAARVHALASNAGSDIATARERFMATFHVPLGRTGAPNDVATRTTSLVSPGAGFLSGQSHAIDGGLLPTV